MPIRTDVMSRQDRDYSAVRHILTSPPIGARTASYIGDGDFDWQGLLAEAQSMSGGEQVLVRIAYDLWEANGIVGVWEIARALDRHNFKRVIEALVISHGDLSGEVLLDAA
jgi:ABC-type iron transport system FetAB ATPase subunit